MCTDALWPSHEQTLDQDELVMLEADENEKEEEEGEISEEEVWTTDETSMR